VNQPAVGPEIEGLTHQEHLGTGGYSDVFLYERRSPRMKVAVKVLKDVRLSDGELAQFAAEAETMAELADHPYIVQVFSTGMTADGRPYLVMKYYPPPNLGARAARERFSVADVLRTGVKISSAVETAHRAGILHRDIKPANILVSQYGEPGLTDFGIAGHAADADDADDLGVSIPWSPPEVLTGGSNGSAQSDVYSLGATVWHLLVGRSPFEISGGDNSQRALMARVLSNPPPPTGRADVPPSLERLLQQAMSKNPSVRPRTALEFARALQAVEQEQRFARTEIVVEGLGAAVSTGERPPAADDGDRTRMRAPVRVAAQPAARPASSFAPATSKPRPAAAESLVKQGESLREPPTTARPTVAAAQGPQPPRAPRQRVSGPSGDAPASTVRRPAAVSEPDEDPLLQPVRGIRAKYVVIIGAAVVVVAVAVGIVLSAGKANRPDAPPPPSMLATDQTALPASGPAPPIVTATYDAAAQFVHFAWTVGPSEKDVSYAWWPAGSPAAQTRTEQRQADVKTGNPATACIQVVVVPNDGGEPSAPSAAVCGG
jgi:hypothetical protein